MSAQTGSRIVAELANHRPTWAIATRLANEPGTRMAWSSSVQATGSAATGTSTSPALDRRRERQLEGEGAARARRAVDAQPPAVGLDVLRGTAPGRCRCPRRGRCPARTARKMRSWSSGAMPGPVSRTLTRTRSSSAATVTSTVPPRGVYFTALPSRFHATWRMRSASASAMTGPTGRRTWMSDARLARPWLDEDLGVHDRLGDVDAA